MSVLPDLLFPWSLERSTVSVRTVPLTDASMLRMMFLSFVVLRGGLLVFSPLGDSLVFGLLRCCEMGTRSVLLDLDHPPIFHLDLCIPLVRLRVVGTLDGFHPISLGTSQTRGKESYLLTTCHIVFESFLGLVILGSVHRIPFRDDVWVVTVCVRWEGCFPHTTRH